MDDEITSEDELKAENELLRLKLEMEHGMPPSDTSNLSPELENEWLSHIYDFENAFKNAGRIKLYDFIGSPSFSKAEALSTGELSSELERLMAILLENNIEIDFAVDYDDMLIYKFITEELFDHEIDNMRVKGMNTHFIYEEFHPNHDYDLRRNGLDFIDHLLGREWKEDSYQFVFADTTVFREKEYDSHGMSGIIITFQEAHKNFEIEEADIIDASFNMDEETGIVSINTSYKAQLKNGDWTSHSGIALINFKYNGYYWAVSGFCLPGL
jgi:hypothetical protein